MNTQQQAILLLSFGLFFALNCQSQKVAIDTLTRTARIQNKTNSNQVQFTADAPELRQIAGAPKAYYTNFWEFGDGHYSTETNPTHTYQHKGVYTVRLAATNNYDDGLPPTSRPKKIAINEVSNTDFEDENAHLLDSHHGFRLLNNREPSPNQEMQFVVSYANEKNYTTQGKLYVFFNEIKYKNKNFNLIDIRTYYGEKEVDDYEPIASSRIINSKDFILTSGINTISENLFQETDTIYKNNLPATLEKAKNAYQDFKVWEFDNLNPKEKRNLFLTFKTTPEMLKDTSAVISIRSIYVPEIGGDTHQVRTKEMEIVTSHDPNKMAIYNTKLNYRLVRFKRLKYKVRFQNNGEGPASLIKLNVDIPEMLDKTSLEVIDMYPKVPICPDGKEVGYSCLDTIRMKDKISFQFKNIYLPGSNQKGVHEKDSTKGFVKYSLKFGKDFHKVRSKSKTAIIFDKNEPIITNMATSRFSAGISIGARAGYNYFIPKDVVANELISNATPATEIPDVKTHLTGSSYFIGATYSPYKSYKWYYQAEAYLDFQKNASDKRFLYVDNKSFGFPLQIQQTTQINQEQTNLLLVPASVRYNLNNIFAVGAGVQVNLRINGTHSKNIENRFYEYDEANPDALIHEFEDMYSITTTNTKLDWNLYDYMPFVDITGGVSRIGPSIGVRYLYPIKQEQQIIQFYAIWKF